MAMKNFDTIVAEAREKNFDLYTMPQANIAIFAEQLRAVGRECIEFEAQIGTLDGVFILYGVMVGPRNPDADRQRTIERLKSLPFEPMRELRLTVMPFEEAKKQIEE